MLILLISHCAITEQSYWLLSYCPHHSLSPLNSIHETHQTESFQPSPIILLLSSVTPWELSVGTAISEIKNKPLHYFFDPQCLAAIGGGRKLSSYHHRLNDLIRSPSVKSCCTLPAHSQGSEVLHNVHDQGSMNPGLYKTCLSEFILENCSM